MITTYNAAQSWATIAILFGLAACAFVILRGIGR